MKTGAVNLTLEGTGCDVRVIEGGKYSGAPLVKCYDAEGRPTAGGATVVMTDLSASPIAAAFRYWTTREIALIHEHHAEGLGALTELLPGRSAGAIYQKCKGLGIPMNTVRSPSYKRYAATNQIDAAIRATYAAKPTRGTISRLADRLLLPRWWISKRAAELGIVAPRFKEPPWTDEEIELLEKNAHHVNSVIARKFTDRGYHRTEAAIGVKRKRLQIGIRNGRADRGLYSACQIAHLMGVDNKTVTRWIETGGLNARRRGTSRTDAQGGNQYEINERNLRLFIAGNAAMIDLRKVDRFWFIELAFGSAKP